MHVRVLRAAMNRATVAAIEQPGRPHGTEESDGIARLPVPVCAATEL